MSTDEMTGRDDRVPTTSPPPGDVRARWILQVEAIDAWVVGRRHEEQALLAAGGSRQDKATTARRLDAMRRTQTAVLQRLEQELARPGVSPASTPTAVVAHRHAWFADKISHGLRSRGVEVLQCTDNAADALGDVITTQPDVVLVGARLAMMAGTDLLRDVARYAPLALRAAQVDEEETAAFRDAGTQVVFFRSDAPDTVAEQLVRLVADGQVLAR